MLHEDGARNAYEPRHGSKPLTETNHALLPKSSRRAARHQKWPLRIQHFLKTASGAAWTEIVATQFFEQFLVTVHDSPTTLDVGFGWESPAALTGALERRGDVRTFHAWT